MFIPDPDFYPSRIQNSNKRKGWKQNCCCIHFFVATNITKLKIILFLNWWSKKIWPNLQRIIELFTSKIVPRLSKIWVWDLRSRIRKNLFRIPDPGVKKAPDPGSVYATLIPPYRTLFISGRISSSSSTSGRTWSAWPRWRRRNLSRRRPRLSRRYTGRRVIPDHFAKSGSSCVIRIKIRLYLSQCFINKMGLRYYRVTVYRSTVWYVHHFYHILTQTA